MALGRVPFTTLEALIRRHLSTAEDPRTAQLMRRLRAARRRGHLTPSELEAICRWKSARVIRHITANSAAEIRAASRSALGTRDERRRLEALLSLRGVSVPMASAVLTLLDPDRYGVIDIRVWQLLHRLGAVTGNRRGAGFDFRSWSEFLAILRSHSRQLHVGARDIERSLFVAHETYQKGTLYGTAARRREAR